MSTEWSDFDQQEINAQRDAYKAEQEAEWLTENTLVGPFSECPVEGNVKVIPTFADGTVGFERAAWRLFWCQHPGIPPGALVVSALVTGRRENLTGVSHCL